MKQISMFEADQAAKAGMLAAAMHADRVEGDWTTQAGAALYRFAQLRGQRPFLIEDVRVFAHSAGVPDAPDSRAWGFVVQAAKRDGTICPVGYAKARSSNGSPKVLWKSLVSEE